jgi:effector-binding domain-containing protein
MVAEPKLEIRAAQRYAAIRTALPIPFGRYLTPLWKEVDEWLTGRGIVSKGPALIRYLTTDMSGKLDMDVGFVIEQDLAGDDRVITETLPAGRYATLAYTGPYRGKGILKATVALLDWAKANQIGWDTSMIGEIEWWNGRVEFYLSDPEKETDAKDYRAQLAFKVNE